METIQIENPGSAPLPPFLNGDGGHLSEEDIYLEDNEPDEIEEEDPADCLRWMFKRLGVVSFGALARQKGDYSLFGLFNDPEALAAVIANLEEGGKYNLQIAVNRVDPARKATNDLKGSSLSDKDYPCYAALVVDWDPVRGNGVDKCPSNNDEHAGALRKLDVIVSWMRDRGFYEPTVIDSGNGGQARFEVDLESNSDSQELIKDCLNALSSVWDDSTGRVDTSMGNPGRWMRCPGTTNRKGEETEDRPYRKARLLSEGSGKVTPIGVLRQLVAAFCPKAEKIDGRGGVQKFLVDDWLKQYNDSPALATLYEPLDWNGGRKWIFKVCPFNPQHDTGSAFFIQHKEGWVHAKCHHNSCPFKKFEDLRDLVEPGWRERPDPYKPAPESKTGKIRDRLLKNPDLEWFTDDQSNTYCHGPIGRKGSTATLAIDSDEFSDYVGNSASHLTESDLRDLVAKVARHARSNGERRKVFIRIADGNGTSYLDLGMEDGRVVKITPEGWEIIAYHDCPVRFRRTPNTKALPIPVKGKIDELWQFVRVREEQRALVLAWLTFNLAHPKQPHPVLFLSGEKGSGKSTVARIIGSLVDPNSLAVNAKLPKDMMDLRALVDDARVQIFDNVSRVTQEQSDLLCCLATGAAFKSRALYKNKEVVGVDAIRPVVLTGIADSFKAPDIVDRTIFVELVTAKRMREDKLWRQFNPLRGALLDGVAAGLAGEGVEDESATDFRMADFVAFGRAAVSAFGETPERLEQALLESESHGHEVIVESSTVLTPMVEFARQKGGWSGDMTTLFKELAGRPHGQYFPKSVKGLCSAIRNLRSDLVKEQVTFEEVKQDSKTRRRRYLIRYNGPAGEEEKPAPVDDDYPI